MALANVAAAFYDLGLRVVLVDFDLEAPGLESFFFPAGEELERVRGAIGLVDVLLSYKRMFPNLGLRNETPSAPWTSDDRARFLDILQEELPPLRHALHPLRVPSESDRRAMWLLPAGMRLAARFKAYAEAVQSFGWATLYAEYAGELYFEWFRRQLLADDLADVVLIDSRTGVTEMGGVCTRQLADAVVCLAAPNAQNIDGVERMAESFMRDDVRERRGRDVRVIMVPSRVDNDNAAAKQYFNREFEERLARYAPPQFRSLQTNFWQLRIPYISDYAYRERLAVGEPDADRDLVKAYELLVAHMAVLAPMQSSLRRLSASAISGAFKSALPEVFVAQLGEHAEVAHALRNRLAEAGISTWPDANSLSSAGTDEGSMGALLDQSRAMLLIVTGEEALSSPVLAIWRAARARGVRVFPCVFGTAVPDDAPRPSWLKTVRFLDLAADFDAICNQLSNLVPLPRVPLMTPAARAQHVPLDEVVAPIVEGVLQTDFLVLSGPAGSGKTTIASSVARDTRVIDHFYDGVLWVDLERHSELAAVATMLEGVFDRRTEPAMWLDPLSRLRNLLSQKQLLLVLDGCSSANQLEAFRDVSTGTVLVLTSDSELAYELSAQPFMLDSLSMEQSARFLLWNVDIVEDSSFPLSLGTELLALVDRRPATLVGLNGALRARLARGESARESLSALLSEARTAALDPDSVDGNEPHRRPWILPTWRTILPIAIAGGLVATTGLVTGAVVQSRNEIKLLQAEASLAQGELDLKAKREELQSCKASAKEANVHLEALQTEVKELQDTLSKHTDPEADLVQTIRQQAAQVETLQASVRAAEAQRVEAEKQKSITQSKYIDATTRLSAQQKESDAALRKVAQERDAVDASLKRCQTALAGIVPR